MEHIVQFAIGIDEDKIRKIMEEKVAEQLVNDVKSLSHGHSIYSSDGFNKDPEKLRDLFEEEIRKVVNENKDVIIDRTAEKLAANLMKTKKVKEMAGEVIDNG